MTAGGDRDGTDPLIGREIAGRYRIEHRLGSGAMGAVYRARHVKVGRSFALKVILDGVFADDKVRQRFQREAELAGKLHHINVVGVVDVGETDDGIHYMVMEFADGPTLGSLMQGPMDAERVIGLVKQLLDGLEHAHGHGLVHRDFKPENVIVELDKEGNERPRIVDFGIALLRDQASTPGRADRLTTAGLVLGTPHYMAPELAVGEAIDHRIDLFALGVTVYELLTGKMPYEGDGVDVARANLLHATPPMGIRVPTVSVDPLLEAFTRKLMEKKPEDRPATAKAARSLLGLIEKDRIAAARELGIELPGAVPAPLPPTTEMPRALPAATLAPPRAPTTDGMRPPPRRRAVAIAAGAVLAGIAIVIAFAATRGSHDDEKNVATTPSIAIPDAGAPEIAIDASVTVAIDPPPPPPAPAITDVTPVRPAPPITRPVPKSVPKPRPKVKPPVVAATPPDTTAAAVANLYGVVGRELKALDTAKGSGATAALWPRYLRIRINDVLTTPEKRSEAQRTLAQLRAEIATH